MDAQPAPERQPKPQPAAAKFPKDFDREAYAKEQRDQVDKLIDGHVERLAADLDAGKSETLLAYLKTMSRFHRYSFGNQILIAIQAPEATHVAGYHAWRSQFGRYVKKGEKGILILAPVTRVVGSVEERQPDGFSKQRLLRRIVNAKGVRVFDVAQTDGKPLPEFASVRGDPADHLARLERLYAKEGVSIEYVLTIPGGALGVSMGQKVQVLDGLPPPQKFQTAVHELAHELLHRDPERRLKTTRTIRETEAEAVAFVVGSAIGLDCSTASSDYLQLYGGSRELLEGSLQAIRAAAKYILDAVLVEWELAGEGQ